LCLIRCEVFCLSRYLCFALNSDNHL
jgi:hypothetical protein